MEIVHLDEFIEVHGQHLESDHQVLAEQKLIQSSNYIFLIFFVLIIQMFDKLGFDETLLVQPLLVFENFKSHVLFLLVIVTFEHDAEATFS